MVTVDEAIISENSNKAPKAPGMKYRHYAPKAEMVIVEGEPEETVKAIKQLAFARERAGKKVGIIATNESASSYTTGIIKSIGSRENEKTVARNLYRILREFDSENVDYIYSEAFSEDGIGTAVMNRLGKAAGHHLIEAAKITKLQKYRKIIFLSESGNCRAPIAAELLKKQELKQEYEILARGMVVLFAEPMNPRAAEMLNHNGIEVDGFETMGLKKEILEADTLVLTMTDAMKQKVRNEYEGFQNLYTLCEFVGESEEIPNVYGQSQEVYEEMFERIQRYVCRLSELLNVVDKEIV